jgi:light-regulated signal transduction histidine kinase (bacteriophytochrome)
LWCKSWWLWHYERLFAFFAILAVVLAGYKNLNKALLKKYSEKKRFIYKLEKQKFKLAQANIELEGFSFIVSHDLQEPIRRIRSFCSLLFNENINGEDRYYLERIEYSAELVSRQIESLRKYFTVQRALLKIENFQLTNVIKKVLLSLDKEIKKYNIKCIVEELPDIDADKDLIKLLFYNLLDNSVKFHSANSNERIIRISASENKNDIKISIRDNGIGVQKYLLEKIFNPFYKAHQDSKYIGIGMGLPVALKISHKHNGVIEVNQEQDEQTVFTVVLPKRRKG